MPEFSNKGSVNPAPFRTISSRKHKFLDTGLIVVVELGYREESAAFVIHRGNLHRLEVRSPRLVGAEDRNIAERMG